MLNFKPTHTRNIRFNYEKMELWIAPIFKGHKTFGSEEYLRHKEDFMTTLQDTFPSEYWKEALSVAFDNKWVDSIPAFRQKLALAPIDFVFEGVKLGRSTFLSGEMLPAKRKFFTKHGKLIRSSAHDQAVSIAFDDVWLGYKRYESGNTYGLYTPGLFCL